MPEKTDQEILLSGVGAVNSGQLVEVNEETGETLEGTGPTIMTWPVFTASALSLSAGPVTSELERTGVLSASAYGEEDYITQTDFCLLSLPGGQVLDYLQNQYDCGACYAYAAADLINMIYYTQCGKFSIGLVLQIIACTYQKKIGDLTGNGCGGFGIENSLIYMQEHGLLQSVKMTGIRDMAQAYTLSEYYTKEYLNSSSKSPCMNLSADESIICYNNFFKNMNFCKQFKDNCLLLGAEKNKDGKCNQETITHPPITVDKILYMWDKKPNDAIYELVDDELQPSKKLYRNDSKKY